MEHGNKMTNTTLRHLRFTVIAVLSVVSAISNALLANNMRILDPEPKIIQINNAGLHAIVEFSFAWDNSWRTSEAPNNWDAAWVFMKWRRESEPTAAWSHCTLAPAIHHIIPAGFTTSQPVDNTGIFIYHSSSTSGPVTATLNNVRLRWDFSAIGPFEAGEKIEINVFAVEMVYVPEGAFYVGSGGSAYGELYTYGADPIYSPYLITSENAISVSGSTGNLYYNLFLDDTGDQSGPIPDDFPKGYRSFYCMKYEITQGLYVDFLNCLNRTQQNARTKADISSTTPLNGFGNTATYINITNDDIPFRRNGIRCDAELHPTDPVIFFCDLNRFNAKNQNDDGHSIANNFMNISDLIAILDWMALRPMTELEYEKACRGPLTPVLNEYAWGNTSIVDLSTLQYQGTENESTNDLSNNASWGNLFGGPMRVGSMAGTATDRTGSGASYYGIMDLTGNVSERIIGIGRFSGRAYSGRHGDGDLDSDGNANVDFWPSSNIGTGIRGGGYASNFTCCSGGASPEYLLRTSNRMFASYQYFDNGRGHETGGRGVRTAP